ncbi:sugar phosphate isomerase/epimerase family protein [Clostridium psychrophilum]|uniref:sugar phosphate isomerase/epimerase family protein n=1 Tax=Clostridium psychrophilum TaxID=132926 RepID=UPI001C0CD772|nr:sugar phosphate isomerase/epimerase [Clostridium psychrophilum]MBU3182509.1 sugar phosphate isomerase/epimerase [Clostridium psychrophilum]
MRKENIVLNTLVFMSDHKKGIKQIKMMETCKELEINIVEIRREFFENINIETEEVGKKAKELSLTVLYSVPQYMYINKQLQLTDMEKYFKEAKMMGSRHVKVVIGDYDKVKSEDVLYMNELCKKDSIRLLVENDQSSENGKADKIIDFVKEYKCLGGEIGVTFDIGNYVWQNESPLENAKKLAPYVEYIHLKDVNSLDMPSTVYLSDGVIEWKAVLDLLPKNLLLALEYPCGDEAKKQLDIEINKLIY